MTVQQLPCFAVVHNHCFQQEFIGASRQELDETNGVQRRARRDSSPSAS